MKNIFKKFYTLLKFSISSQINQKIFQPEILIKPSLVITAIFLLLYFHLLFPSVLKEKSMDKKDLHAKLKFLLCRYASKIL